MIYYKCKHKFNVLLTRTVAHLSHVFSRVQCVKVVEWRFAVDKGSISSSSEEIISLNSFIRYCSCSMCWILKKEIEASKIHKRTALLFQLPAVSLFQLILNSIWLTSSFLCQLQTVKCHTVVLYHLPSYCTLLYSAIVILFAHIIQTQHIEHHSKIPWGFQHLY